MNRLMVSALGMLALAWSVPSALAQDNPAPANPAPATPIAAPVACCLSAQPCCPEMSCCPEDPPRRGSLIATFGMYFIQPNFETNPAYLVSATDFSTDPPRSIEKQHDFAYGLDGAPEVVLGYVGPGGTGARVRYFEYAHGAGIAFAFQEPANLNGFVDRIESANVMGFNVIEFNPAPGDLFSFFSSLNVLVWDFEVLHNWTWGTNWSLTGGAGIRYAHLAQTFSAFYNGENGAENQELISGHNFNGAGPLVTADLRRRFGQNGLLGLYATGRAAVLFGSAKANAFLISDFGEGTFAGANFMEQSDVVPVGELEVGLEVGRNTPLGRAQLQLGFVGHVWWGAGNASNSESIYTGGSDSTSNLGFVGLVVRGGLAY
jgi:hypothetical protein